MILTSKHLRALGQPKPKLIKRFPIRKIKLSKTYRQINCKNYSTFLLESIKSEGILMPLTLNKKYELLNGGVRLMVAKKLKMKTVPVIIIGEA